MPGGPKADIKFGFWVGVGLLLLMLTLVIAQLILARVRGQQTA